MNKYSSEFFDSIEMKDKVKRLSTIKEIITESLISNQEDLLRVLSLRGYDLTQATLSRDLKHLKVIKAPIASGKYIYKLPDTGKLEERNIPANMAVSIHFSGNIVVLHTRLGHASSLAYEIDARGREVILGTVAGEDTIIAVARENISREVVIQHFSTFIPNLVKY